MNLRKVGAYNIGLDIGVASVGWAVTDESGQPCTFKGKPTWGSRIFEQANPAADARSSRGLRRRYDRRRQRLDLLQEIFSKEIANIDPEFFIRLNQSRLHPCDKSDELKDFVWPLFNDSDFNEVDYYQHFPTIYHLRAYLASTTDKADIRLIYLALHNIVKHRGNFLYQDNPELTAQGASVDKAVEVLCLALTDWAESIGFICDPQVTKICEVLSDANAGKSQLKERLMPLWGTQQDIDSELTLNVKKFNTALSGAIVGASAELADIFFLTESAPEGVKTKIYLSKEEDIEEFNKSCPDEAHPLFEAMQKVYSAVLLQNILSYKPGQSISINKIAQYNQYGTDLQLLKALVREYKKESYNDFFRGDFYEGTSRYNPETAKGYTKYNSSHNGYKYEDFSSDIKKLFDGTGAEDDPRYIDMMQRFDEEKFLRRLKTSDNGAIPFQLHLEEMHQIIENQSKYYPFLKQVDADGYSVQEKIESLVTFRIPYYVGPLTTKNAAKVGKGEDAPLRFAWSVRQSGAESRAIRPWNWEEIIDKDASAENFIMRMTGTCTYIQGEPVLPKSSLLYEEFCVLNELNGAHYTQDGDKDYRFDYLDRADIFDDLFKHGSVTYKKVEDWLNSHGRINAHVRGGQGERGFESKLSSYLFFRKALGVDVIDESDYPMIEELILWSTIFEDKDIYKRKIKEKYSDRLSEDQIKTISKKRFTGWGKLSKKFLEGIKVDSDDGVVSIMDVLRRGNPNYGHKSKTMVLMEVITNDELGFNKAIEEENKERVVGGSVRLEDLPGSPALRRGINQALRIVDEIVKIAGHAPSNIFIEVTREEDESNKGRRTKKRYDVLSDALTALKKESPEFLDGELLKDFKNTDSRDMDERLTLYFMQAGKSLYSGKSLNIQELHLYQVDHILPQSYIKDDSFENKALVLPDENQTKTNELLLPHEMRKRMRSYWDALHHAGLIGDKKYKNLNRDHVGDNQMKGFIARQLVETSQIVKLTQVFLAEKYPETNILPVKAGLSSQLKDRIGIYKCREANDYHHAHDALLACTMGRFIELRYEEIYTNPIKFAKVAKNYIQAQSDELNKHGRLPGGSTFIVDSFLRSGFDEETGEIFRDTWNASEEIARLKKCVNDKRCYISRMTEVKTGPFWDQTIYSSRSNKTLMPIKKGLTPQGKAGYGGYSGIKNAYYCVYKALDKKGRTKYIFAGVPVSISSALLQDASVMDDHFSRDALERNLAYQGMSVDKILPYTLIEYEGNRYYVNSLDAVGIATEVAFDQDCIKVLRLICEDESQIDERLCIEIYDYIVEKIPYVCTRIPAVMGALYDGRNKFIDLKLPDKKKLIKGLITYLSSPGSRVDLSSIGGAKSAGQVKNGFISRDWDRVVIIDQSVTGMFESIRKKK